MTFSSASLSAWDVEDVAATAAAGTFLRGLGRAACWRVAGARTGGAGAGAAGAAAAWAAGAVWGVATGLGIALREIGRGFGRGTFGLAQASKGKAASPTASARLVASADDRNAAARSCSVNARLWILSPATNRS